MHTRCEHIPSYPYIVSFTQASVASYSDVTFSRQAYNIAALVALLLLLDFIQYVDLSLWTNTSLAAAAGIGGATCM